MDTRTTDERMVADLDSMISNGISVMIKNPGDIQKSNANKILNASEDITKTLPSTVSPTAAMIAGEVLVVKNILGAIFDVSKFIKDIATGNVETNPNKATAKSGDTIPGNALGGVVPAGYPNDTYPTFLTSGETITPAGGASPDVAQLTAAIVAAINNQTKALTSNGFGDYYA